MRKIKIKILIGTMSAILMLIIAWYFATGRFFAHKAVEEFAHFNEFQDIPDQMPFLGPIFKRQFSDDSWIAVSSCSKAGGNAFNIAVMRCSDGTIYSSKYPFSGFEGLSENLGRIEAGSISEFLNKAIMYHFQRDSDH